TVSVPWSSLNTSAPPADCQASSVSPLSNGVQSSAAGACRPTINTANDRISEVRVTGLLRWEGQSESIAFGPRPDLGRVPDGGRDVAFGPGLLVPEVIHGDDLAVRPL